MKHGFLWRFDLWVDILHPKMVDDSSAKTSFRSRSLQKKAGKLFHRRKGVP